jgi:hypothetical protein
LHSGDKTPTYSQFSLRLHIDQLPYLHQLKLLCFSLWYLRSPRMDLHNEYRRAADVSQLISVRRCAMVNTYYQNNQVQEIIIFMYYIDLQSDVTSFTQVSIFSVLQWKRNEKEVLCREIFRK